MEELQTGLIQREQQIAQQMRNLAKIRGAIQRATKDFSAGKSRLQTLRTLATILTPSGEDDRTSAADDLSRAVEKEIAALEGSHEHNFLNDLRAAAETAGLPIRQVGDERTLGPFVFRLQPARKKAGLIFAKVPVGGDLPIDVNAIVNRAAELTRTLLAPPKASELPALATELEEAIRVACARQKAGSLVGDLRAELPAVYRELSWMRGAARAGRGKDEAYPLPRFVVELKSLVSSEFNLGRSRRFKLETAVIENTRNAKKSIFVPNQLEQGYGEGTFFQAVVLLAGV